MNLAPIALFVYNRLDHTEQTVSALKRNLLAEESDLFVFSDAPKNSNSDEKVRAVRAFIRSIAGFKSLTIVERPHNFGLANSIIDGVTNLCNEYGQVIVLEDDLVTSPYFLKYMNDALDFYRNEERVISIHGYIYPVKAKLPETFFMRGADCWGWATWKEKWAMFETDGVKLLDELKRRNLTKRFDFNGAYAFTQMLKDQISEKNNSWAVRWYASAFLNNKYTLYPSKSLVLNIGNDGSGTHCGDTGAFSSELCNEVIKVSPIVVEDNQQALLAIEHYFRNQKTSFIARFLQLVGKVCRVVIK